MDIVGTKVLVMVLTSVIPIFLSLLPLWFKKHLVPSKNNKSSWREVVASVLLCFGGGVLLATSLVHLLPEVWLNYNFCQGRLDRAKKPHKLHDPFAAIFNVERHAPIQIFGRNLSKLQQTDISFTAICSNSRRKFELGCDIPHWKKKVRQWELLAWMLQTHFTQRSARFISISRTCSRMRSATTVTSKNYFYFARYPSEFGYYPVLRRMAGTRYCWREMGYIAIHFFWHVAPNCHLAWCFGNIPTLAICEAFWLCPTYLCPLYTLIIITDVIQ